ncbi:hypothetical protein P5673_006533 [Acropora cervicornis]|uniref:Uncharacterized protein n=1 Tax=Acropora cervicornis TaxID=6130 RepID=A0AAD9VC75_ACRCE|nr:hypothetical protein P5673_006533 [Acropora cervicornis]
MANLESILECISKAVSRNQNDFKPSTCPDEGFKHIKHDKSLHSVTSTYPNSISVGLISRISFLLSEVKRRRLNVKAIPRGKFIAIECLDAVGKRRKECEVQTYLRLVSIAVSNQQLRRTRDCSTAIASE